MSWFSWLYNKTLSFSILMNSVERNPKKEHKSKSRSFNYKYLSGIVIIARWLTGTQPTSQSEANILVTWSLSTNERPVSGSRDHSWPMRGQCRCVESGQPEESWHRTQSQGRIVCHKLGRKDSAILCSFSFFVPSLIISLQNIAPCREEILGSFPRIRRLASVMS